MALAAIVGVTATAAGFRGAWHSERERARLTFEADAAVCSKAIERGIVAHISILHSIGSFFSASQSVERDEFMLFTQEVLGRHPEIQEVEWLPRVPAAQVAEFAEAARRDGVTDDFRLIEQVASGSTVPASLRPEYYPAFYVEPGESTSAVLGVNRDANPQIHRAMARARDTGEPTSTSLMHMWRPGGRGPLVCRLFLPVYINGQPHATVAQRRRNLMGFVMDIVRADDFLASSLGPETISRMRVRLFEVDSPPAGEPLGVTGSADAPRVMPHPLPARSYSPPNLKERNALRDGWPTAMASLEPDPPAAANEGFSWEDTLRMGDRTWRLRFSPAASLAAGSRLSWMSWIILVGGLTVTTLGMGYLASVVGQATRVRTLVDLRTAELSAAGDQLRRGEAQLQAIMENVADGLITCDELGTIQSFNPAAEHMFGRAAGDVLGGGMKTLLVGGLPGGAAGEGVAHRGNGSIFPADWTLGRATIDGRVLSVLSIRDSTERHRNKEELERARDLAQESDRAKSEFLANMSHEIRTPMNGILGMTELALGTALSPRQREYLNLVRSSTESLLTVINDILDFSRIEARKLLLDPVPFAPRDLIEEMMQTLAVRAHEKGLELACRLAPGVPDSVIGDPHRFRQVIVNLVGNAIKFTERGEVVVSVEPAGEPGEKSVELRCTVSDTGIGIPADKLRAVFEPFEQADGSTTRRYGGTGLGLAISSRLVELMGGRIEARSEPGVGSTFQFTVPFLKQDGPAAAPSRRKVTQLGGLPVLIVDDNATNRRILEEILGGWGMRATSVENGPAALVALRAAERGRHPFAVVLIDGMMPGMDGIELIRRIRSHATHAGIILVLLSSASRDEDASTGRALGIAACLTKPVRQSELFDTMVRCLEPQGDDVAAQRSGPDPGADRASRPAEEGAGPLCVLLAEDNPVNQKVAVHMLERLGHSVTVASDGQKALDALREGDFDVVLMDVQMPHMDGLDAVAALRLAEAERPGGRRMPVIALTAHAMKGDRERCLAAGFDRYLSKPVRQDELHAALASIAPAPARVARPEVDPASGTIIDRLLARCEHDREFALELSRTFLESVPPMFEAVSAALERGDATHLEGSAHSLKGSCLMIGDDPLACAMARIEEAARRGDLDAARARSEAITDDWSVLLSSLSSFVRQGPG